MKTVDVEMHVNGTWQTICQVEFIGNQKIIHSTNKFAYMQQHQSAYYADISSKACGVNYPVTFDIYNEDKLLGFIDDIIPAGAARRKWLEIDEIKQADDLEFALLTQGAISPVGNLRIKSAVEKLNANIITQYFPIEDVINRDSDFLSYAHERGALTGGATGAGGEAPKLLLRVNDNNQVWIDCFQNTNLPDKAYLIKFPRGARTDIDKDILRAEYSYYQVLSRAGYNTIDILNMKLEEGVNMPSLWLPRFDLKFDDGQEAHYGLESILSTIQGSSGAPLNHFEVISKTINNIRQSITDTDTEFDEALFVCQWFERDVLNVMFGNADNHARNSSLLKSDNKIELSPIYDFAPMRVDPEDIRRTITWGSQYESGGEYQWKKIIHSLAQYCAQQEIACDETILTAAFIEAMSKFESLPEMLVDAGCPISIIEHPKNHFRHWKIKHEKWVASV
ncbi:type II toxin-antitoxin system HipA family toxin (plasmid) [Catenovulum sp. SX2]|uniref:type II toxin-antitoxin system HipA family toxin n=1 Tax=Catenovulum sp. SX2 TaxID=3398614 RepID=UPI003F82EB6B